MPFLLSVLYRQFFYTPPAPTASFEGKTIIVTGANVGLGKAACQWLVRLGASQVILACRNLEKGQAAAQDIQAATSCSPNIIQVWPLDLGSYASVLAFAEKAKTELPRLDALLSNAGLATRNFNMSEGNEEAITTNVISLFLHAFLLLPKLHETAVQHNTETYFTVTSSELHVLASFKEKSAPPGQLFKTLSDKKQANMPDRYNLTKLLEVFVIKQMAAMFPVDSGKVVFNCTSPGFCITELTRDIHGNAFARFLINLVGRKAEVGARTIIHGASAGPESHGQYMPDTKITPTQGLTTGKAGAELQARVWTELKEKLEEIKPGVTSLGW